MTVRQAAAYPRYVAGTRAPASWGMMLFILTEGVFFTLLFSSYFYLRSGAEEWPVGGLETPKLLVPSINTVLLVGSSIPMWRADASIRKGNQAGLRAGLMIALLMGIAFLALQFREFYNMTFRADENAYASLFIVIIGFHGAHLFVGLLMNAMAQVRAWLGHFDQRRYLAIQNVSLYWHFVDLVWVFIFAFIYISPHIG
jgi:heme/copper-type cytochrome/quinol oxidase subunit 3